MIVVKPEDNKPCFILVPFDPTKPIEPISLDVCYRCFGGMLFLQKKKTSQRKKLPIGAVYVWHITPGYQTVVLSGRHLLKRVRQITKHYEVTGMARCGGMLNKPKNKFFYAHMYEHIEKPLEEMFPGLVVAGYKPVTRTLYMTLVFNEKMEIISHHEKRK